MKKKLIKALNLLLFLGLSLVLLYFAFRKVHWDLLWEGFAQANYWWVLLALAVCTLAYWLRALRWRLLMEPLGYMPSVRNTFGAVMIGFLANLAFPRIGEITRCGMLRKTDGIPFESLLGTVIVERTCDVVVALLLVVAVFLLQIEFFGTFIAEQVVVPIMEKVGHAVSNFAVLVVAGLAILLLLLVLIRRDVFGARLHRWFSNLLWGTMDGLRSVYTMRRPIAFALYTVAIWGLFWVMTYFFMLSTAATQPLTLIDGLFIMVVGSLGMAAPVQGGFGAFHIITAMGLSIYGISWTQGMVFATISHESQVILIVVVGLYFLSLFYRETRRRAQAPARDAGVSPAPTPP